MAERIDSGKVLPPSAVGDVYPETGWERFVRTLPTVVTLVVAIGIIAATLYVIIYILLTDAPHLHDYRNAAWGLLSAIGGAAAAHIFGERFKIS